MLTETRKEYDLNGYRISQFYIQQTAGSGKDVWFVDEVIARPGGHNRLKNIAQFDTEDDARAYTGVMWHLTN